MTDLLRAEKTFRYAHRTVRAGETFLVHDPRHTKAMTSGGARIATLIPEPSDKQIAAAQPPQPAAVAEKRRRGSRPKKGTYLRRDMTAE